MITHRYYWGWQQVDFQQLMARLGRTGQVQAAGGLLAFIVSFFPWIQADLSAEEKAFASSLGVSTSFNAWHEGAGAGGYFTWLLLLGLAVVAVLSALAVLPKLPMALIGVLTGGLTILVLLLHWLNMADHAKNAWGYYLEVVIAIAVTVVSYLGMKDEGSSFNQIGALFQQKSGQAGPPPGQGGPGGPYGQG